MIRPRLPFFAVLPSYNSFLHRHFISHATPIHDHSHSDKSSAPAERPKRDTEGRYVHSKEQKDALAWAAVFSRDMIPYHSFTIQHARSSGAGGQHVNRTDSKVEMRFCLDSATWLPALVRERLRTSYSAHVTNDGHFIMTSQRYRAQVKNHRDCLDKIYDYITQIVESIPKETSDTKHELVQQLIKADNERRIQSKKIHSKAKQQRRIPRDF